MATYRWFIEIQEVVAKEAIDLLISSAIPFVYDAARGILGLVSPTAAQINIVVRAGYTVRSTDGRTATWKDTVE